MGFPIKGDLKYGAKRSNPDGSISLIARSVEFVHPVSKKLIHVEAPLPDGLWKSYDYHLRFAFVNGVGEYELVGIGNVVTLLVDDV